MDKVERLVMDNQKLVHFAARKFSKRLTGCVAYEIEDLIQEGNVGLILAAKKFDETLGYQFSTYAISYIYGHMKRFIYERAPVVRYRKETMGIVTAIYRNNIEELSVAEISKILDVSEDKVEEAINFIRHKNCSSFNATVSKDGEGDTILDVFIKHEVDFDSTLVVDDIIDSLPEREQFVLRSLMAGVSSKLIASKVGVTRQQVYNIKQKIRQSVEKYYEAVEAV